MLKAHEDMNATDTFKQHPLFHFLHEHPCGKDKDATITGMDDLKGKWHIPDTEYSKFLDLLHDYLFVKGHRALGFVERPRVNVAKPSLTDLDFHYKQNLAIERRFTRDNIHEFCEKLAEAYEHFFDLSGYESIRFFVTLRPQPYPNKEVLKDGIHIISPEVALTDQKWNVIRKYLLGQNVVRNIFGNTDYINNDENVYDEAMGRAQGWMFYGASKKNIPAYKLTNIFVYYPETKEWMEEDISEYEGRERELLELMSIRYNVCDDINTIKDEAYDEFDRLANPVQQNPLVMPPQQQQTQTTTPSPSLNTLVSLLPQAQTEEELNVIRSLVLECLSAARADDYHTWIRVGWCLHNIYPNDEMFQVWMDFSKKSPKFNHNDIGQLRRDWHIGMRKEGDGPRLGIRSLYKWARDDNKEKYNQIIDADTCEYIIRQTDATHYHIARLMKKMYGSLYIASVNSRNTEWFHYDEILNMWRHLNQGMELRQKICIDVANQIQSACDKVRYRYGNATTEQDREIYMARMKLLNEMQGKLYNSGFNDSVMKMGSVLFYEEDFMNKLNINPFLFGCANGVLELRHKEPKGDREHVIFRQGRPEDYVSFLAGKNHPETEAINYKPYDPEDPRQAEIQEFFRKLFPREDLRKHVLKLLASCLEGANREQLYYFFIGVGSNGKSKLVTLMKLVFGDYQTSLQSTVLTRKRPESGAANPDIMAMKGRRFIYSQEPDDKEPLNTSRMKQLSGEDMLEARPLFGDQEKFKVMGKMFMMCNRLPPINSMDNGTWRRIRVIPFESRFEPDDHPDLIAGKPHVYPRDNFLDDKMISWREPFLSYLVHLYETEYIPNGLTPEPQVVKQESEKYKADHDVFAKFRIERIRERRDGYEEVTNEQVTMKDIQKAYKRWADSTGAKRLDVSELTNRCEDAFGDSRGKKIYTHIRVFNDEEDVEEFDRKHTESQDEEEAD